VESSSAVWSGGDLTNSEENTLINILNGSVEGGRTTNANACNQLVSAFNVALSMENGANLAGPGISLTTYWFYLPGSNPVNRRYWKTTVSGPIDGFDFETLIGPRQPPPPPTKKRPGRGRGPF
jgi:hypothetical protein